MKSGSSHGKSQPFSNQHQQADGIKLDYWTLILLFPTQERRHIGRCHARSPFSHGTS